ncbi:enhanced serine sensitivity protein SseB C-terminal domain-containing protein [Phyllobacterium sp. YR531]|uniref:enhanced serine sensitivity protein SseB C-terminal domain-containing protein n=1 Tax=Phyllobacterium sp. YR531 TaxID=1144343 RepID=UPI00026F5B30|nr:enhanced serine sensitivity protein SseB C-terminal domain-containing protein [Phyllobacterium sp. YR531]EJN03855.1 SseB protein [Phyllobacterium sp. YR531]
MFGGQQSTSKEQAPEKPESGAGLPNAQSEFTPQNELEQLLVLAADDASKRNEFQQEMLNGDLFIATPEAPENSRLRTIQTSENLHIRTVNRPDGGQIPAVFSSEARIAEVFGTGTGFMRMSGADLLKILVNDGAVLNPGLAYGVHWTPEALAALLGLPVRRTIEKATQIMLGTPSEPPEQLIEALRRSLDSEPEISEAWFALAIWPEIDGRSWYIDVRSSKPADEVSKMLSNVLHDAELNGLPVDIIVKNNGEAEGVGIRLKPAQTH